jgi:hypothetical protein
MAKGMITTLMEGRGRQQSHKPRTATAANRAGKLALRQGKYGCRAALTKVREVGAINKCDAITHDVCVCVITHNDVNESHPRESQETRGHGCKGSGGGSMMRQSSNKQQALQIN